MDDEQPISPRSLAGHELYHQHLVDSKYEREDVQKKTFGKWINSQLVKVNFPLVTDLFYDLRDGTRLLALLGVLTGRTFKPERGQMRVHHLNNVSTAFRLLDKHNVKLVNISSNDIVDGNPKLTLGLVWSIILHWQVQDVLKGNMAELHQSSLDKTLLGWCREATKDYAGVDVTNFTTSWSDGLAFIALIHRFRPDLYDYEIVSRKPANARLDYAFRMANKHLGIARLLDPEDVNTTTPDKKSIMMYVMCLYQALPHNTIPLVPSNGGGAAREESSKSSTDPAAASQLSSSGDQVDFTAYQTLMEEVLVWLLAAEDHLDSATSVFSDLHSVKEQFHKHEEFLLELTSQQGSVGAVLQEGTRLLKEGQMTNEEADEIRIQMRLLNNRWDQLRTKAMDRQARIHEALSGLQLEQLERLRVWLTATEDRISQLGAVLQPADLAAAVRMLGDHQSLQQDLEAQRDHVNALSNMVVIVDDSAGDNCSQMEDQLAALGERWSHVCQWAEQRSASLTQLVSHWEQLDADLQRLKTWLAAHEHSLRLIEANPNADRSQMIDVARQLQLLERDMKPHLQRLNHLQENTQRLPSFIQAVMVKEKSKRILPGSFKCVDRLSSEIENLEDRIEALNEIMEAQKQRLAKSGVDVKMVVLPPDITTSLSAFGSTEALQSSSKSREEESTSTKKRKLDSNRQCQYDEAVRGAKQHLDELERLLEGDDDTIASVTSLEQRHSEQKSLLDQVLKAGHILIDELQNESSEIAQVEDAMGSLTERWLFVEEMLKQKRDQLSDTARQKCEDDIDAVLNNKTSLSMEDKDNQDRLTRLKALLQSATECTNELTSQNIPVESLKTKTVQLESRIADLEKNVLLYVQLKNESQSLDNWMTDVQKFLTAEDIGWGDADVIEAQLEQSNGLQEDVKTLEPSVSNIKRVIGILSPLVDEDLLTELNRISDRLNTTWVTVVADAERKNSALKEALHLTRRAVDGITSLNAWLNEMEGDIQLGALINSTSELSQTLRKLNALKNRADLKASDYKSVVDAASAVLNSNQNINEEFKNNFDQFNQKWNDVVGSVLDRQKALKAASHHYGEFKVLTAQECDWQDKLDKKLMRSTTVAADAEEISEELDDLENYLKNRQEARITSLQAMGNELISLNIMADSVGLEVRNLTERWASLNEKAKDKVEWLENRVRGAQQCEQRLVQLHNAISAIDAELCSSLDQDLYGDELPELCQRLGQDIAQQETLLKEIRQEEEGYEAEGRIEAANRLHEQLAFIEGALQDVRNKFRKFQNPFELEPRLERMMRVLRDLEQSMCYIELASDDSEAIEGQLNNCIRFYTSLSDIKTEVEAVLKDGRQQVEDGLVENQAAVSAELDSMKALYNRLGEQVADARETLERALQLSNRLNAELSSMNDWLNDFVAEIHKQEDAFGDNSDVPNEILFYEKCLNDMTENHSKLNGIREDFGMFCSLCDPTLLEVLREKVEDQSQEWQRIEDRLRSKIAGLKEGNAGDDDQGEELSSDDEPRPRTASTNGELPTRMYRSVVLTSVREFTDPESPTSQKDDASLMRTISNSTQEDSEEAGESDEPMEVQEGEQQQSDPDVDDFGYFNAAFEDFDESAEEDRPSHPLRRGRALEVVRGDVNVFNEEDEDAASSSSDSSDSSSTTTSTEPSETDSVKHVVVEGPKKAEFPPLQIVQVTASQLPSPEVPSVEILNSRPLTPEVILRIEEVSSTDEVSSKSRAEVELEELSEHRLAIEQAMMKRFNDGSELAPTASQDRAESPIGSRTPPPTPAYDSNGSFHHPAADHPFPAFVGTQPESRAEGEEVASDIPPSTNDQSREEAIHQEEEPIDQHPSPLEAEDELANADKTTGSDAIMDDESSKWTPSSPEDTATEVERMVWLQQQGKRRTSRDEGTQTDLSGFSGVCLHGSSPATTTTAAAPPALSPTQLTHVSIIQPEPIPLQVDKAQEAEAVITPMSTDGEVFSVGNPPAANNEDADSFYGSDKEVDGEVIFSHTDTSPSGTSSSGSDVESDRKQIQEPSSEDDVASSPLDKDIRDFNREVAAMLERIEGVATKFSPSSNSDMEQGEIELSLLEPDVATLISRGDGLVLRVQTDDMDRALKINATTAELRQARSNLKAAHEVRRQRLAEQELTLKECQQQTEQLQLWLADTAKTLDHVIRVNDQSKLQELEEELNRRQSDIRSLSEAASKLQEQQLLEYQELIGSLTDRWQELQRQFVDFQAVRQTEEDSMGGPDFVSRVNKLREAIASVSRQLHSPPLNLKHYEQLSGQEDSVKSVKSALYTLKGDVDTYNREKDEAIEAADAPEVKEQIQRVMDKLREEWTLLNRTFAEKQGRMHQSLTTWRSLHADMKDFEDWLGTAEAALTNINADGLNRAERKEKLKELEAQVTARHKVMNNMTQTCREVGTECSTADSVFLREKQDALGKRWRALLSGLAAVRQRLTSLDGSPLPVAKYASASLVTSSPRKEESESSSEPTSKEPTTPTTIVASLDKSILQIRDWLTVLETMLKQQVAIVGDADDVVQLLERQKNVLRELEQKKPQLDELVQTAESIKDGSAPSANKQHLPAQVSKLREHWEETAGAVTSRRNQLEDLLADSHQFERRRQDADQWLGRMEGRLAKLAPVAQTADLIDAQHREQKTLLGEIQGYKGQVDQLAQLTERLVHSYPHDDSTRVFRTNENIAHRYSALHTGVNARGKALNAAMGTLHSFDRSLDKFMTWLSDAESSIESLELELDNYGPGVKTSRERVMAQLKELSVELDGRREEQVSLAASGQRLINTLSDGSGQQPGSGTDDALMLRRRLDDMNRRWHGLRAKTVAIRNRLENNTEHWNALLLSLRELIEWVIRKDTELTGLGPIRADLSTLIKQQDDFRAFRRQLDDKRPLIEQSILTGRQLVANEAPLSDASDSEATRELLQGDSRGYRSAEEAARELTNGIRREVTKLAERWAALRDRTERWNVDLDTTSNRVQQLQASMEDACNRLSPAESARSQWVNPSDLNPQLVQHQLDQLKELSDKIAPVQLMIEEVNDQAARLADSGVPLSHANLSRLDELNSRWKVLQSSLDDRYQQLCGVTRDGALSGPLLQSFLAPSVDRPWERSVTEADVPYYVNHQTETTQWDHPQLEDLMNSLSEFNDVRFSAYRMALKLRRVQKFLSLDKLELSTAIDTFDAHGLRAQNDKVIDIPDMVTVLRSLFESIQAAHPTEIRLPLAIDLCLNWILNVYDSQRAGEVRVLSFKVIITLMCRGHLEEKYRYLFRLIADPNRLVDAPKLGVLLHDCVQIPRELGEVAAFGGSNIEPSVKSCFDKAGKQRQTIEAVHFLAWMKREPQSVVWLPVLHRLAASESARHQNKCNVCKATPIVGLRYRCLKCLSFDMCQACFFTGRVSKHHKLTHPMQEYCTTTTSGEDIKDFTRTLRNKFKSKRYFKKHPRLGYLPVQTALEGTTTPSDFQSEASSHAPTSTLVQDVVVHSAATSVMDGIHKDFTPDSEDEHQLIAQYCRSLNGDFGGSTDSAAPRSPVQLLAALDSNHKEEIETMIKELEEENATLQAEYERLRSQQSPSMSFSFSSSPDDATPIPHQPAGGSSAASDVERDMLAEARMLRQHKSRLEARMKILEEHNRQLESQLSRLRQLLDEPGGNVSSPGKTGTLQTRSVTAAHLATDTPVRTNGVGHDTNHTWAENTGGDRIESRPPPPPHGASSGPSATYNAQNVGNLLFMAGDLGKAVGTLVNVMTDDHSPTLTDEEN